MWDCAWTCYIQGLATYLQQTNNNVNRYKQSVHCWFWCFHGFVERNKKNVRIQTQFGEKHLQMFVFNFFYCIYLYFLLRKSGLNLFSVCLWCQEMTAEWDTFTSVLKPSCFLLSWFSSLLMTLSLWRSQTTRTVLCDAYWPSSSVDCNFQLELHFP